ncbi:hypothetical protein [Proteiniborus sp. MB09-C3]|uniref:hypothetical protein n=1 Tax=Proteiniborus sp. MB09-C3 TaxID=3050072 RepID=UPI002557336E|nr:hypothetical protein [Proteiniborus sp. MB09-C3]WIV10455.1 hypothetical protein QO263_09795 [Proteiniborus sp. MB09-C3]
MVNDNKNIEELIEQIKDKIEPTEEQLETVKKFAEQYSNKSGNEILFEIIKLNKKLTEDMSKEEFMSKLNQLEALRPLLNEEQNENLDRLLKILKAGQ